MGVPPVTSLADSGRWRPPKSSWPFPKLSRWQDDLVLTRRLSTSGLITAVIFLCFSFTPTLIPRDWLFQGVASGLSLISGYGVGALLGWAFRKLGFDGIGNEQTRTKALRVMVGIGGALVAIMMVLGARWQNQLRELMGMERVGPEYLLVLLLAVAVALLFLVIGRAIRWTGAALGRLIGKWIPPRWAGLIGAGATALIVIYTLNGLLYGWLLGTMNDAYSVIDQGTRPGVEQPQASERSGSPSSPIAWESLGSQGRTFVAGGRSQEELAAFAASEVGELKTPIRVYAGLASEPGASLDQVAQLVVSELDRTNAWDRKVLVVTTTTGTGWVDPGMSESVELIHAGDTAIAAMQYSFLPSWVSFVADRTTPPAAGKALFEAVYAAWSQRPADDRPLLIAYGVSLGSFGGQGAFSGLQDMVSRTDGAIWVGSPNFSTVWRDLTDNRDPGSFEWSPVYRQGEHARWGTDIGSAANVWDLGTDWEGPRVVYVQHASDGVVWWSFDLITKQPDWMREPPGPDVLPVLRWIPFVSFWQITMDMFVAGEVPSGFGHNYQLAYADAWAAVAPPDGWTDADTSRLREALDQILNPANG